MGSTKAWLLVGLVVVTLAVLKFKGNHGDVRVTGRGTTDRVATISHGEPVEIGDHISPNGKTIVEFTADW